MSNSPINHITVHCSASFPNPNTDAAEIDRWHRARGFKKIGYHFVIKTTGEVETGRTLDEIGAHVEGQNTGNLGVCLVGGVDKKNNPTNNFTDDQFHSLAVLLSELLKQFPKAEILGHRDWPKVNKACPCFDVRQWWHDTMIDPIGDTKNETAN